MRRPTRHRHRLTLGFLSALSLVSTTNLSAQAATETDALDRRVALENRLNALLRHLPPLDQTFFDRRQTVTEKELGVSFQVRRSPEEERLRTEDGYPLPIVTERLEIHGQHPMASMRHWLEGVGRGYAIQWVEELALRAGPGGVVDLTATVVTAGYSSEEPEHDDNPLHRTKSQLERLETLVSTIEGLDARPDLRDLALVLAAIDVGAAANATRWTELRYAGGRLELEGVTAGSRAWEGLKQQLKDAGLTFDARQNFDSGCHRVTLSGQVETVSEEVRFSTAKAASFHPDPWTACLARPTGELTRLEPRDGEGGAFTLHLRDLQAADLFNVLHRLGGSNFVIDEDVTRRLSGDFVNVSEDDLIDALQAIPIHVTSGPLRRVSTTAAPSPSEESSGEPISAVLRQAPTARLLCVLGQLESREVWVPAGFDREMNLFTGNVSTGLVLDGVLAAAGLRKESQEERWLISGQNASDEPEFIDACSLESGDDFPWIPQEMQELSAEDVRLIATGRRGDDDWLAFAYVPGGHLMSLSISSLLGEATVQTIDGEGITLSTGAGTRRINLSE